jgi:hypothetical protein
VFALAANRMTNGGNVTGNFDYEVEDLNLELTSSTITSLFFTGMSANTAQVEGTGALRQGNSSHSCRFRIAVSDNGKQAEDDDVKKQPDTFTLTYCLEEINPTTVDGLIDDGHIEVMNRSRSHPQPQRPDTPLSLAVTGPFSGSLAGVQLTGARAAAALFVHSDGTTSGDLWILLGGTNGTKVDIYLHPTSGGVGAGTAMVSGTAAELVSTGPPVTLPATATLTAGGSGAGVQLTVNGAVLTAIPIRFGRIQIG